VEQEWRGGKGEGRGEGKRNAGAGFGAAAAAGDERAGLRRGAAWRPRVALERATRGKRRGATIYLDAFPEFLCRLLYVRDSSK